MTPHPVKWYAVTVDVIPEAAESVEFAFNTLDAAGTEIDQMPGGSREIQAVIGYFDSRIEESAVREEILNSLNVYGFDASVLHGITIADVEERDWLAEWKKHWKPTVVGPFVVVPPWDAAGRSGKITITIEPKMAFGTGTHETTQLCLEAIGKYYRQGASFLDVGTGTGILAIAAAKLNEDPTLARIYACDTDAEAV
ncbi:MAG: 50S ribosomal protein L11 methyltransferase, partial [Acidobacteriota bacterium]